MSRSCFVPAASANLRWDERMASSVAAFDESPRPTRSVWPVLVLGLSFHLVFLGFNTVQGFMTTVAGDLGFLSLCLVYASLSVASFVASVTVRKLGPRRALYLSALTFFGYILTVSFGIRPWQLLPMSVLLGIGAAVIWTANGAYLAQVSTKETLGTNSGLFWGLFYAHAIVGNLMAAYFINTGHAPTYVFLMMAGICGSGVAAMAMFLPDIKLSANEETAVDTSSPAQLYGEALGLLRDRRMRLLLPLMIYHGLSQGFIYGAYPLRMGKNLLGFVMACYGLVQSSGSYLSGRVSDRLGRRNTLYVAISVGIAGMLTTLVADKHHVFEFFLAVFLLGSSDAGTVTQLYAMVGSMFDGHTAAAFGLYRAVLGLSMAIQFVYSLFLPFWVVWGLLVATLAASILAIWYLDTKVQRVDLPPCADADAEPEAQSSLLDVAADDVHDHDHHHQDLDLDQAVEPGYVHSLGTVGDDDALLQPMPTSGLGGDHRVS